MTVSRILGTRRRVPRAGPVACSARGDGVDGAAPLTRRGIWLAPPVIEPARAEAT